MRLVRVILSAPLGPSATTVASSSSQGIAPGATKLASEDILSTRPQTALVSRECGHVGLSTLSNGAGLRKCVMTWPPALSKSVACGPNGTQLYAVPTATHT